MRLVTAIVATAVLSATPTAAQAAQAPILVKGFAAIGAFQVRGGGPIEAKRAFGKPAKQKDYGDSCTLSWPGLEISFYTLLDKPQCTDSAFGSATITRPWVTDRGLRKGDPVSKAKSLYAAARNPRLAHKGGIWLIVRLSPAIGNYGLTAVVSNGRVTALQIDDPQGGE